MLPVPGTLVGAEHRVVDNTGGGLGGGGEGGHRVAVEWIDVSIYTLNSNEQSQNINWKTDEVCQSAVVIVCLLRAIGTGSEHFENTTSPYL